MIYYKEDTMNNLRTHYAGEVLEKDIDSEIVISGWVKKHRDLGELIFMDIRDISGICQVVINNEDLKIFDIAKTLKMEYVVSVKGKVRKRQDINPNIPTGTIEIVASEIELINKSLPTPISIEDEIEASEETRMDYRYLDLRRPIYRQTAAYGHFGREEPEFSWEARDLALTLKSAAGL